jgi:hypothetical protein
MESVRGRYFVSSAKKRAGRPGAGRAGAGQDGAGRAGTGKAGTGKAGTGKAGTGKAGTGKAGTGKAGTGKAGERPTTARGGPDRAPSRRPADSRGPAGRSRQPSGKRSRRPPAAPQIVGAVSPLTRAAGGLALLAALVLLVRPALPLVRTAGAPAGTGASVGGTAVGGTAVGSADNLWDFVVVLPAVAVLAVAGAMCVRARLPRFGLAAVIAAGALGVGELLRVLSLLQASQRLGLDLPIPAGQVRVFRYSPGPGLWLWLAGCLLLVAAGVLAVLAYRRTDMDDDGSFDRLRPLFGGLSLVAALLVVGGIVLAAADPTGGEPGISLTVPQRLELDRVGLALPAPDLPLSVNSAAAMALVDRPALDQLGGLLLALAAAVAVVLASTLRPRLAAVGMYLGLAGLLGSTALSTWLLIIRSTALSVGPGAVLLAAAALALAGLALAGWRMTPPAGTEPAGDPR